MRAPLDRDTRTQPGPPAWFRGAVPNAALVAGLAAVTYAWGTATQDELLRIAAGVAFGVAGVVIAVTLIIRLTRRDS
ncbi:MAG: hypothetical protein KGL94_02580 [Acidobacteriota bacterium]|nr:hypothetical protein [Acidobacteriota bacterium]